MSAGRLLQANLRPEQFLKRAIVTSQSPLNALRMNEERGEMAPPVCRGAGDRENGRLSPAGPLAWPCSPGAVYQPSWREAGPRPQTMGLVISTPAPCPAPTPRFMPFPDKTLVGQAPSPSSRPPPAHAPTEDHCPRGDTLREPGTPRAPPPGPQAHWAPVSPGVAHGSHLE